MSGLCRKSFSVTPTWQRPCSNIYTYPNSICLTWLEKKNQNEPLGVVPILLFMENPGYKVGCAFCRTLRKYKQTYAHTRWWCTTRSECVNRKFILNRKSESWRKHKFIQAILNLLFIVYISIQQGCYLTPGRLFQFSVWPIGLSAPFVAPPTPQQIRSFWIC